MLKKEEFPDGDLLIYDGFNEVYHILNKTPHEILCLLKNENYEVAKSKYLIEKSDKNVSIYELKEDFENVFKMLLNNDIILEEGNN